MIGSLVEPEFVATLMTSQLRIDFTRNLID